MWCILLPEKGTWGQSKDIRDRENHVGDMGGMMGIWGMLPPFAARAEHRADGKGSPGAAMVKSRMLAVMLL